MLHTGIDALLHALTDVSDLVMIKPVTIFTLYGRDLDHFC